MTFSPTDERPGTGTKHSNGLIREAGTWDYQWAFACWLRSGLSVLPNVNLVSNIGFGRILFAPEEGESSQTWGPTP